MTIECACAIKSHVDDPGSLITTVLEFLFSLIICGCGITINYIFMRKLEEEKRNVPLGRKGNVIEPIMRWFLKLQLIYWPYHLTFCWMNFNHIIPTDTMTGWWCNVMTQVGIKFGRMIIMYNSTFIALVRYLYIVHHNRVDKWDYEKMRKGFRFSSIVVPIVMESIGAITSEYTEYTGLKIFTHCMLEYQGLNNTNTIKPHKALLLRWTNTSELLSLCIYQFYYFITALISLNVIDGVLYFEIFRSIKRYVGETSTRGWWANNLHHCNFH